MGFSSVNLLFEQFLYNEEIYDKYAKKCYKIKDKFNLILNDLSKTHYIIGYGAAAKGNTFLNFSAAKLDYIIDDNPMKHNLLTPGSNIPIESPNSLKFQKNRPTVYIPLAWNFFEEIKNKINEATAKKNFYLFYFPEVKVEFL